jgi:hypothetical protein
MGYFGRFLLTPSAVWNSIKAEVYLRRLELKLLGMQLLVFLVDTVHKVKNLVAVLFPTSLQYTRHLVEQQTLTSQFFQDPSCTHRTFPSIRMVHDFLEIQVGQPDC